ncbi:hypothetical protein ACIA7S_28495 [Streptomyces sp. NPDC051643]|uniref:hypothetical protein n=1 Tax=Streptomyces sp. NPDC051643 TaxID=3365665 RepID=UPI0037A496EE
MAGPKAAGVAGGSPQHTPKQDDTAETADTPAPFTPDQVLQLLDQWKAHEDENQRAQQAYGRVRAFAEGHTQPLTDAQLKALEKLREPFEKDQIEKRPQPWCKACNASPTRNCDKHEKKKCKTCNTWVTEAHDDLDYVGHAGATARLLAVDPTWDWEPLAVDDKGLPYIDERGGMWIKLIVCGMERKGYGDAIGKKANTTAVKEIIGDAIRNAAMRFGMALDLWSKADLHKESEPAPHPAEQFIKSIQTKTVWESTQWLSGVRQEAEEAGQLDYAPPGAGGTTLAEIIDGQLAHLEESARIEAELRVKREEERKAATAQVAAEHGVGKPTAPPPGGQQQPPAGNTTPNAPGVDAMTAQDIRASWKDVWLDPDSLQTLMDAAQKNRVANDPANPNDSRAGTIGQVLRQQINALRRAQQQRAGTAQASQAAHQYAENDDWGHQGEFAG